MTKQKYVVLTMMATVAGYATQASACAVCFADPGSSIAQGATWGVAVLLGVVSTVLTGIVGMILFWVRRARQLEAAAHSGRPPAADLRPS